ncbi:MAG: signal peptidase II [Fretibacterium sp.]|nr:signal peptidase II [Fretibacterium sp.]
MGKYWGIILSSALLEFAARIAAAGLGATFSANPGLAFGLLKGSPALARALPALSLALLLGALWRLRHREDNRTLRPGLAVMAGGAAANLIDRLLQGAVRDWIPLPLSGRFIEGGLRFNLADAEICLGAAAVLWALLSYSREKGRDEPSPPSKSF